MKKIMLLILATLTLVLSACSASNVPSTPTSSVNTSHSFINVSTTKCEEDQPCWDCQTMGNLKCGDEAQEFMENDAYNNYTNFNYKAQGFTEPTMVAAFNASYIGTYSNDPHWPNTYTIHSTNYSNYYHVFQKKATK